MRTTVVLDSDVAKAMRQLRRKTDKSFRELLNETLRAGLALHGSPQQKKEKFAVRSVKAGFRPGIDIDKLNRVLNQLDTEDFVAKHSRRT